MFGLASRSQSQDLGRTVVYRNPLQLLFFIVLSVKPRPLRARHERARSFTFSLMKGSLSKRNIGFPLCLPFLRNHVASSATVPSYHSIYLSSLLLLPISAALPCETESKGVSHPFLSARWCDFITWWYWSVDADKITCVTRRNPLE